MVRDDSSWHETVRHRQGRRATRRRGRCRRGMAPRRRILDRRRLPQARGLAEGRRGRPRHPVISRGGRDGCPDWLARPPSTHLMPPRRESSESPSDRLGDDNPRLARLRRLARWLDAGVRIPGTNIRFGLDPIIGLIPGVGDSSGAAVGGWILLEASRLGVPRTTLLRIAWNIAVDAVIGAVPFLGDLFDVAWKSNLRNVALLERHALAPGTARRSDTAFVAILLAGVLLLF